MDNRQTATSRASALRETTSPPEYIVARLTLVTPLSRAAAQCQHNRTAPSNGERPLSPGADAVSPAVAVPEIATCLCAGRHAQSTLHLGASMTATPTLPGYGWTQLTGAWSRSRKAQQPRHLQGHLTYCLRAQSISPRVVLLTYPFSCLFFSYLFLPSPLSRRRLDRAYHPRRSTPGSASSSRVLQCNGSILSCSIPSRGCCLWATSAEAPSARHRRTPSLP